MSPLNLNQKLFCSALCRSYSLNFIFIFASPFASAIRVSLPFRREHVIVHRNHHGNKYDRVIEQMQFDPWEHKLKHAAWNWFVPEIVMRGCLVDEQEVFDVMPELNS